MKRYLYLILVFLAISGAGYSQLSGTYTIGSTEFPSIAFTIDSLNSQPGGIGTVTGVVFEVPAGYIETFADPTDGTLTATGSAGGYIVFKKTGTGTNPLIKAAVGTSTTTDGIIKIAGGDYIIFDGIDLIESAANTDATTQMEWGYALVKGSATTPFNGCQYVTIKNCVITLNKANPNSVGIYSGNHIATATTSLTITAASDAMNFCQFYGNNISNVYIGIQLKGYAASSPYTLYDHNNEIGRDTANYISNFGGGGTTVYGIYAIYQDNLKIVNNIITGGTATTTLYGIFTSTGTSSSVDIYDNEVTIQGGGTTSSIYAISNAMGSTALSNTVNINDNLVYDCTYPTATTGTFTGIVNSGSAAFVNVFNNIVRNNVTSGTGSFTGIDAGSSTTLNFQDNKVYSNSKTSSGTMYCMRASTSQINLLNNEIHDNSIDIVGGSSSGTLYGYYNLGSPTVETYTGNLIYNLTVSGTTSSTSSAVRGIYTNTVSTSVKNWSLNQIYNLSITTSGGGNISGMYSALGTTINVFRNKLYGYSASGANPTVYGVNVVSGTTTNLYNNLIGNLETPNANAAIPLAGIYVSGGTTVNAYYNTVYLNGSSTGTLFGSAALYASTSPALTLKNNIFVNTSTPNGTGITAAYRRSNTTLTSYANASDYNYFFAGTPDSNNVVFYDGTATYQTLANYQALVTPRDGASATNGTGPAWLSIVGSNANYLHIDPTVPSPIESGAIVISGFENDYDNDIRFGAPGYVGTGTATDIGADEFNGLPNYTCTSPSPGATVASSNPACYGLPVTLSIETPIAGTGVTYQWMLSPDGTAYSNIPGAIEETYTFNFTAPGYYQCKVTCQNGPVFSFSTAINITLANSVTSTTPGSRCGVGTVQLEATGSAGTTLNWYSAPSGGTILGTGSPFTTPTIGETTSFYVAAEVRTPGTGTVGAGATTTATYSNPFYSLYSNLHSQILVKASELAATGLGAGNLTSVALDVTSAGTLPMKDFSLKIASTTAESMTDFVTAAFTVVDTTASFLPVVGLNTINFETPFYWDGESNIVLEFCHGNPSSTATMSRTVRADNTSYVSNIKTHRTSSTAGSVICGDVTTNKTSYSLRPKLVFEGQNVCSSQRASVVATVTPAPDLSVTAGQTICANEVYALSVTSVIADFDTYTWSPVTNLFTDAACTLPYVDQSSATTVYVKSTSAFSANYTCTATNTSTNCVNVAVTAMVVLPASVSINATPEDICFSGTSMLSLSPSAGYGNGTIQWQESGDNITFTDIPGANSVTYTTPPLSSTKYYKVLVKNEAGTTCTEAVKTIVVNTPTITGTTPGTRCGIGTVVLGATGTGGTLTWYSSPNGGTPLGTGSPFTTPVINTTTSYYVGSVASGSGGSGSVGPVDNTIGAGGYFTSAPVYYTTFDVLDPNLTLNGVYVYPNAAGNVVLVIRNSADQKLHTITYPVTTANVKTFIPINVKIPAGTGYKIGRDSLSSNPVGLYRNTAGGVYPYTLPGIISITGNTFTSGANYYYYCYDWQVSTGCSSALSEVVATVVPGPPFNVNADQTVCNDGVATLQVTSILSDYDTYVWSPNTNLFIDAACTLPYDGTSSRNIIYAKTSNPGVTTYTCTATKTGDECVSVDDIVITVLPANPVIEASPVAICVSGSAILSVSPSSGWGAANFQWQVSTDNVTFTDINGAVAQTYNTPTITSTTYYRVVIKNSIGITCIEPTYELEVDNPQVLDTDDGTRCGTGTVTLGATGSAGSTLKWYPSASGGTVLGTGSTFVTPVIEDTTVYYVSAEGSGSSTEIGGRTNVVTTSGFLTTPNWGVVFDITQGLTLNSTTIYPVGTGTVTIALLDASNTEIAVTPAINVSGSGASTPNVVNLGFTVAAGTNYKLVLKAYTGITDLLRESSGNTFPYTSPSGALSVTGGWTGSSSSSSYYWFYSIEVSIGCSSARLPVTAFVTAAPGITASATPPAICAGESTTLNVNSGNAGYTYVWTPGALAGPTQVVSPAQTTVYTVEANDPVSGCAAFASVPVTVNALPESVLVTPPTANVGSVTQLVASGGETVYTEYIGDGGYYTTNNTPYKGYWGGCKTQNLYLASELSAYGLSAGSVITKVAHYAYTFSGPYTFKNFSIAMKNTSSTVMTTTLETGTTTVLSLDSIVVDGTVPFLITHTLATPFVWDGTSNLLIETCFNNNNGGGVTGNSVGALCTLQTSNLGAYYSADNNATVCSSPGTATATAYRTDVILEFSNSPVITWSPTSDLYMDAATTIPYSGQNTNTVYANPSEGVTYTATATNSAGCTSSGTCVFSGTKELVMKLFLEGLYNGASAMNQAFDDLGPHFPAGVADQVNLELRDATTGDVVYSLSNVNLATNGFINTAIPSVHNGSYYIYIYHRNSITTSTAVPVSFAGSTITYDLTIVASSAFGDNMKYMNEVFVIYGGDVNQDGLVDSSDMIAVDNDAANFAAGYIATDVTGDGLVDSSDMILIDNNSGLFISTLLPF